MSFIRKAIAWLGAAAVAAFVAKRFRRTARPSSRREQLRAAYREAANDPEYQAEMAELDRAFDVAIADGLESDSLAHT